MFSLNQAAAQSITRIRRPEWSEPCDHFQIDIVEGKPGPWIHLYSPMNDELHGSDPVNMVWAEKPFDLDPDERLFEEYKGPWPGSRNYERRRRLYVGMQT